MSALLPRPFDPAAVGPLEGCRVLDLSRLVSGGHCGMVLADLGADVIKIERPDGGDELRGGRIAGVAAFWTVYNRNKRSVSLNLKSEDGRRILLDLIQNADALLENFRPGTLEKLGLGPDVLLEANPRLVITRISGWGQTGPYCQMPGFGTLAEAVSGFMHRNGFADRPPAPPPTALADMVAGLYAATATVAAVLHARGGGPGQTIDVSLFEPLASIMGPDALLDQLGHLPTRGEGTRASSVKGVFRTSDDKWLALSAGAERIVKSLFAAIGEPDVLDDPRYSGYQARLDHRDEINAIIGRWIENRTSAQVLEVLRDQGVTIAPVLSMADARQDPHFLAREVYVDVPGRDGEPETIAMHNVVPRMSATPSGLRRPAPRLGEHNDEVLAEIGVSEEAMRDLVARGVLGKKATEAGDA
ncbi:Crotonobetainyl-CoA:carnitine CoA-transferase CaiB [Thermomonospora echinospora]|uniref:Crotonobetainyl-CoA:carnitine CoA-transferase CaiB n=1 Tax=Thermomonospora echinospora TaxID=1992 RepID=A0A1H6E775_9ACTN|nr:CaiB/BaiF CoA-transferase family protein [Thermomonospora echinospora]SEG92806.1 Crotonobetainyl-CoA:carnitine CoA-transferase CaiB [Thermomonospora echinospora]